MAEVLIEPGSLTPEHLSLASTRGSNLGTVDRMQPRMAVNEAQHKIVNLLKALHDFFVITCHNAFNMWPKTTLLLPVWPRDAKRLDTPV